MKLEQHGIDSFIIRGNHDAPTRATRAFSLKLPARAHLLPSEHPETIRLDDPPVAIHGQSFSAPSVVENLAAGYPAPIPGHFNIGLLHTNCGSSDKHDNYAPSTVAGLKAKGYDYWALGHIHQQQVLHRGDPWIVYSGNLQGRSVRETGPKGCYLLEVEDSQIIDIKCHAVDSVRWAHCQIDVSSCADGDSVVDVVADTLVREVAGIGDRLLAARIELIGASRAHGALSLHAQHWQEHIRQMTIDRFDERVWLEKVLFRTTRQRKLVDIDDLDDALGELLRDIRDLETLDELLSEIGGELKQMRGRLPTDPRLLAGTMPDIDDPQVRSELLDGVKRLLIPRMLEPGGET